jgi:hypothetical protein
MLDWRVGWLVFMLAAASLGEAIATEVIYRYTDAQGRVTFSETPPGPDETRTVVRVPITARTNVVGSTPAPATLATDATSRRIAAQLRERDAMLDRLQADIDAAKAKLKEAEAALAAGGEFGEDERQWTISYPDPGVKPDKNGRVPGRNGKVMCQIRPGPDGQNRAFCPPIPVPNEAYYARQAGLQARVAEAQQGLRNAETAYRLQAPN